MKRLIEYFSSKHILTNVIVIAVLVGAFVFWHRTNKEELPNIEMDFVRISARYPGATAEEVEYYLTKEIEEALSSIDGIDNFESTSSQSSASVRVELSPNNANRNEVIDEIKDAMDSLRLPADVEDAPSVREFKSSKKPILDLMLIYDERDIMNLSERKTLQAHVDALEDKLLKLPAVSEIRTSGYIKDYIEIRIKPEKLVKYNISLAEVISAIKKNNIKQPLGTLDDETSTKVRLDGELAELDDLRNVVVQSSFEGYSVKLKDVASVIETFSDQTSIYKVNGSEAIRLVVVKSTTVGILDAIKSIKDTVTTFQKTSLHNSEVRVIFMDDESVDIRNRLSLIAMNGLVGFGLILFILFLFLNAKSAVWVAMGIPFTFGFTMIFASLTGNTINNMTLAAVIIVMGMIVDDAIVVAENVSRLRSKGVPSGEAVVKGTASVMLPIVASITTTCAAFVPLYFFKGRFGLMIKFLPPIIFLMLGGSLFEAIFILPAHLRYKFPRWVKVLFSLGLLPVIESFYKNKKAKKSQNTHIQYKGHWFYSVEDAFGRVLQVILRVKWLIYLLFIGLLLYSGWIFKTTMKFSMFPREETTMLFLSGSLPKGTLKYETEKKAREVEAIFESYLGKEVTAFTTSIARSRRGAASRENVFSMSIEILPKEKRMKSTNALVKDWENALGKLEGFDRLRFSRGWFGSSSGSAIEVVVKDNNDNVRDAVANEVLSAFSRIPALVNAELETQLKDGRYTVRLNRDLINRLSISIDTIATTLRTVLEGNNIYDISRAGKDQEVIVTVPPYAKKDINAVLNTPIQNRGRYLIPLHKIVSFTKDSNPASIKRLDGKRAIRVYADLKSKEKPREIRPGQDGAPEGKQGDKKPDSTRSKEGQKDGDNTRERTDKPDGWKKEPDRSADNKNTPLPQHKVDVDLTRDTGAGHQVESYGLPVNMTPLEIAEYLETNVFPEIIQRYPSVELSFGGEVKDSREAGKDFQYAIIIVIVLIYIILALTLDSLTKPLIIMLSIPFGAVGIILALKLHGMTVYGFFSVIGALGLAGVVVNDSIVLMAKLDESYDEFLGMDRPYKVVARVAKTRLRAVLLTTITTVAGLLPTAYGFFGYDSMLAEMMLTMAWGLMFGTLITLILVPSLYCSMKEVKHFFLGIGKELRKANKKK